MPGTQSTVSFQPSPSLLDGFHSYCSFLAPEKELHQPKIAPLRAYDADGTIVSVCHLCLSTIAIGRSESEIGHAEVKHICDPRDLEYAGHSPASYAATA